jgi:hypothetical protein
MLELISFMSAPVVVSIVILLILTGYLVPRATMLEKIEEAERWRKAYEAERNFRMALSDALDEMIIKSKDVNGDE